MFAPMIEDHDNVIGSGPPPPLPQERPDETYRSPPRRSRENGGRDEKATTATLSPGSLHRAVLSSLDDVESILHEPAGGSVEPRSLSAVQEEPDPEDDDEYEYLGFDEYVSGIETAKVGNTGKGNPPKGVGSSRGGNDKPPRKVQSHGQTKGGRGRGRQSGSQGRGTGGHGGIYRVLLDEAGSDEFENDTPEYIPSGNDYLFVPKGMQGQDPVLEGDEESGGSVIRTMGVEVQEYRPQVHSIKPAVKSKKTQQEKR